MKSVGILGGIGPESTIEYYRLMIAAYKERVQDDSSPSIVINSLDVRKLIAWMNAGALDEVTDYLLTELQRLVSADVDFAAIAANTPHIVFDRVQRSSSIPLVSIVEATAEEVKRRGMKTVMLLGTKFTMTGTFYRDVFMKHGIELVVPAADALDVIHDIYINELLNNVFKPESRDRILAIVSDLRRTRSVEGMILGGTELPLLLTEAEYEGVQFFDTTKIHVGAIVDELLRP